MGWHVGSSVSAATWQPPGRRVTTHDVGRVTAGCRVEGVAVDRLQDPPERAFPGHQIAAGQRVAASAEAVQDVLRGPGRPLPDRGRAVVAGDKGGARGQYQDYQQRMA